MKMERVLVIRFSSLGDIVLTFPSLDYLISAGHEVHVLTKQSFLPLLAAYGRTAKIHTISDHASLQELIRKAKELRRIGFSMVFDLHRNLRSFIVTAIVGQKYRRVHKFRLRELTLYFFRRVGFRHVFGDPMSRFQEALKTVGAGTTESNMTRESCLLTALPVPPASVLLWQKGLEGNKGYVCISPESAWRQKEWALDRYLEVGQQLVARGLGVIWIGLRALPDEARFHGALDLTGKLSLPEVAAVLQKARVLLCNDSGLLHLAEAVGTPVVAVFGPTSRELGFGPRLRESRIVEADLWCRPCSKTGRFCIRPVERWKCLEMVSTDQVLEALTHALAKEQT